MLTVKFMKYDENDGFQPTHTTGLCIRHATAVHVRYEANGRAVVQCGDAPGETFELTVGEKECAYNVAYVMNDAGKTVDTIR
jgi:hypothetical protein